MEKQLINPISAFGLGFFPVIVLTAHKLFLPKVVFHYMKKELSRFQVNLTSGYSLSSHPQQHLAAALAAAQQQPRVSHPISVSLGSAQAPATMTLSGLTSHPQQQAAAKAHPLDSHQQHITQTVFLSPPASGSPSGTAPNLALNLATYNHSVPITPTTPGAIPSIAGLPMMAVKLGDVHMGVSSTFSSTIFYRKKVLEKVLKTSM